MVGKNMHYFNHNVMELVNKYNPLNSTDVVEQPTNAAGNSTSTLPANVTMEATNSTLPSTNSSSMSNSTDSDANLDDVFNQRN